MTNDSYSFDIFINENAGAVQALGRDALLSIIEKSAIKVNHISILPPDELFETLRNSRERGRHILIGGGDGTIKSCAEILIDEKMSFGILPLGTMNLLARDIGVPPDLEGALAAYAEGCKDIKSDVGMINGHLFLCCVGIGTMPESAAYRENIRQDSPALLIPRMTVFVFNQMDKIKHRVMKFSIDGRSRKFKTAAVVVSNNQYAPHLSEGENNFTRPSLQDGKLGVYSVAPQSLWQRIRVMLRLTFGDWRQDPVIHEYAGETVSLDTLKRSEMITVDGETETVQTPLNFWVRRKELSLLAPMVGED